MGCNLGVVARSKSKSGLQATFKGRSLNRPTLVRAHEGATPPRALRLAVLLHPDSFGQATNGCMAKLTSPSRRAAARRSAASRGVQLALAALTLLAAAKGIIRWSSSAAGNPGRESLDAAGKQL